MTAPLCHTCARPDPTGAYVCTDCAHRARRDLAVVADVTPAARAVAAGQTRRSPAVGASSGTVRLQLNLSAASRLDAVQGELTTWVRHVLGERGGQPPTGDLIAACAAWLSAHIEWLRHQQEAAECFADIATCRRLLVALVDGPGERRWLGQCGADTDGGRCTTDLYARTDANHVTCRTCAARYDTAERRAWLDGLARGYSYTAAEIEAAYGIRAGTIRVWAHRGRVAPSGHDRDGRPVYPLGAVLDLARDDLRRKAEAQARRRAA